MPKSIFIMIADMLTGQQALVRIVDIWKKLKLIMFVMSA
jgi:hypothetical protein